MGVRCRVSGVGCWVSGVGWPLLLSVFSGVLLALPFLNGALWPFAWGAFVPLLFAVIGASKRRAFFFAYLSGLVFWSLTGFWLVHVTLLGTIVIVLYLALYFGLFGLLSSLLPRPSSFGIFILPSLWVLLEYARSHVLTGFPWALLGYSQYLNLPAIQIADIAGVWGVSFAVVLCNAMLASIFIHRASLHRVSRAVAAALVVILSVYVYGLYRLNYPLPTTHYPPLRIAVVQGNIPQELKWRQTGNDAILQKYLALTATAAKGRPDLVIWPEASFPVIWEGAGAYYSVLTGSIARGRVPLLVGAVTLKEEHYHNSAILLSQEGRPVRQYDKIHLVPFGEYIPLRRLLPFLSTIVPIGDIERGHEYTLFHLPDRLKTKNQQLTTSFGVLICFEDVFPELAREFSRRGADLLVNITNDAWYKKTPAAYQHCAASVFRAVENRRWVARAANTGVSAFIAPTGAIASTVHDAYKNLIFVDGIAIETIDAAHGPETLYTRYGDRVILLLCVLIICSIFLRPAAYPRDTLRK